MKDDGVIKITLPPPRPGKKVVRWSVEEDDEMIQEIFHRRMNSNFDLSRVKFDVRPENVVL